MPGTEIVGRDEELQALSSFLEEGARPGTLLIQGDPGIGKTTLWRAAVEAARELSCEVLRASPAEKESTFAYSVVSDLLADVPDEVVAGLPAPQRRGLEVALLLRDAGGPPPEQHTLGVALLGVLRALSASRPLVLAIDDVQWLDQASTAALVARLRERQQAGCLIVLATHDLDVAEGLLSRAISLKEGRMVGTDTDSHGLLDRYRKAIQ